MNEKKQKILSVYSVICYAVFLFVGILISTGMMVLFMKSEANEGLGEAIVRVISFIFALAGGFYSVAATIPLILRFISIKRPTAIFPIICVPFDFISLILSVLVLRSILLTTDNPYPLTVILFSVILLLTISNIIVNALSISDFLPKNKNKKKQYDYETTDYEIK